MRPFAIDSDIDSEVEQRINKHMKPLLNVLYQKGQYYIYQADSLLNEPGLAADLSKKTKIDRYFVTSQIKSIAGKASIVVANSRIPQIEKALELHENKHLKALKPLTQGESEDEEDWLDPLYHESRATVSTTIDYTKIFIHRFESSRIAQMQLRDSLLQGRGAVETKLC